MIYNGFNPTDSTGQPQSSQFPASGTPEGSFSGNRVTIAGHFNERRQIPEVEKGYEERSLHSRKTKRTLATLSAIAMGVASALFIIPAAVSLGAFTLGSICTLLGAIGGPHGMFIGSVVGGAIGSFAGFTVAAYFTPYLIAKVYNLVLEATNGNGFERSNLADRVVAHYEGSVSTSRA
ncbi:hypothetical protein [Endozoicomonas sp. YOMI1]|uniref:hypothetical protein n=1 Tax=Endozoicomonas sp. YOMI1 TaxID=2828739 RepID=UPI0021476A22|nr:hypothetical protein [Endozoicomonas sp. YOMI1]